MQRHKILLYILFSLQFFSLSGQDLLFSEDFSVLPTVFTYSDDLDDLSFHVYEFTSGDGSGNSVPNMMSRGYCRESNLYTMRSNPYVVPTGSSSLSLEFDHVCYLYDEVCKVQYRKNGGSWVDLILADYAGSAQGFNGYFKLYNYSLWSTEAVGSSGAEERMSLPFVTDRFNITGLASGDVIEVQFVIDGIKREDISQYDAWYIDNVVLKSKGACSLEFSTLQTSCVGSSLSISNILLPRGANSNSLVWTVNGVSAGTGSTPNYVFGSAGSYVVTMTLPGTELCSSVSYSQTVVVSNANMYTLTANKQGCTGVYYSVSPVPPTGGTWSFGDGQTSNDLSILHSYGTNGIYTYNYSVLNYGCPLYGTVTINELPVSDFSYSLPNVCDASQGASLSISSYLPSSNSYFWEINGVTTPATGQTGIYQGFHSGLNIVKLKVLSSTGGCVGQTSKQISFGGGASGFDLPSQMCMGSQLPISMVVSGATSYVWTVTNGQGVSTTYNGQYPPIVLTTPGVYSVKLETMMGSCVGVAMVKQITVSSPLDAHFSVLPSSCGSVNLSLITTPSALTGFSLSYGDNTPVISGSSVSDLTAALSHSYTNNGYYTVQLTLNNGSCSSVYSQQVHISNLHTVSILGSSQLCLGSNTNLSLQVTPALPQGVTLSYEWRKDDAVNGSVLSTLSSFTVLEAGTYYASVVSSNPSLVCFVAQGNVASKTIVSTPTPQISSHTLSSAPSCNGALGTGVLAINFNNSTPYSYTINTEPASQDASYTYSGLQQGDNYLTIHNASTPSCSSTYLLSITTGNIVYTTTILPSSCSSTNGSLEVDLSSGQVDHYKLYDLTTNALLESNSNGSFTGLASGTYKLVLEYGSGCELTSSVTVGTSSLNLSLTNPDVRLCKTGNSSAHVVAQVSLGNGGSTSSVVYHWYKKNGTTWDALSSTVNNCDFTSTGFYKVEAQLGSCVNSYEFEIKPSEDISIGLTTEGVKCYGEKLTISSSVYGGVSPYSYSWLNYSSTASSLVISNYTTPSEDFTLNVVDAQGCTNSESIHVEGVANSLSLCQPAGVVMGGSSPENYYHIDGCQFTTCAQGGSAPYNFSWYLQGQPITVTTILKFTKEGTTIYPQGSTTPVAIPPLSMVPSTVITDYNASLQPIPFILAYSVAYPYTRWTYAAGVLTPTLQSDGTPFDVTTQNNTTQEVIQHSHIGLTNTGNFVTGNYHLVVTDSKGCKVEAQNIAINVSKSESIIPFEFVWEDADNKKEIPVEPIDVELVENIAEAVNTIMNAVQDCMANQVSAQQSVFESTCLDPSSFKDYMSLNYTEDIHQYTLYYHDRSGQLVKTVPPEGVDLLSSDDISKLITYRQTGDASGLIKRLPDHRLTTKYRYNGIGQLLNQHTEDGGTVCFIYDENNRLRFSQNADQKLAGTYSYTRYDDLGRAIEAGESSLLSKDGASLSFDIFQIEGMNSVVTADNLTLANDNTFPANGTSTIYNKQVTISTYTEGFSAVSYYGQEQRFLINRISGILKDTDGDLHTKDDQYASYYSYDPHGNVEWLIQETPGIGQNTIRYEYDLISGKVLDVFYNEFREDKFMHKYFYDAENRLTSVKTSKDGYMWDEDARYKFYKHGALKRLELGEDHVQGLDYLYTTEGWLKSINSPNLTHGSDPGNDGAMVGNTPADTWKTTFTAQDIFGMSLGYYQGDYNRVSGSFNDQYSNLYTAPDAHDLYNGNIAHWVSSRVQQTAGVITASNKVSSFVYNYDLLNRLSSTQSYEASLPSNPGASITQPLTFVKGATNVSGVLKTQAFDEQFDYDRNGNISNLTRRDDNGDVLDDLTYGYELVSGNKVKNRLDTIIEVGSITSSYGDIVSGHGYKYDERGNLTKEKASERLTIGGTTANYFVQTSIEWTVTGKVSKVNKTIKALETSTMVLRQEEISFGYDAMDMRVQKTFKFRENPAGIASSDLGTYPAKNITHTYYVHDATGNSMAVYEKKSKQITPTNYTVSLTMIEQSIYGSSRIGQNKDAVVIAELTNVDLSTATSLPAFDALPTGINTRSEYQNWITTTQQKTATTPQMEGICQCKVRKFEYVPTTTDPVGNPNYLQNASVSEIANFLGVAENGVALAEDIAGKTQFYTVLAKNYMGATDACLVYDVDGRLMKGMEMIENVDVNSKPIIVNLTGTKKYALITRTNTGKLTYHIIDMELNGYGTINPSGEVVSYNLPLSSSSESIDTKYGLHLTGLENHLQHKTVVYATRYTPLLSNQNKGKTEIVAYDLALASTSVVPTEYLLHTIEDCGNTNKGELQISPNGSELVWWQYGKNIAGFAMRTAEIYILPLQADKLGVNTSDIKHQPISSEGSYGRGVVEFSKDNNKVLYSQRGVYDQENQSTAGVWEYSKVDNSIIQISPESVYLYAEIKRGVDGNYYMPNMGKSIATIQSYDGATFGAPNDVTYSGNATTQTLEELYAHTSSLPTQVFKQYGSDVASTYIFSRTVGEKVYELNDHLGNVRVVISDIKMLADNDNSNSVSEGDYFFTHTMSYADYYAFGSLRPNRHGDVGDGYRYGAANGQEKVDEISGDGNHFTAQFWEYDSRLARRWNVDPVVKYHESPYATFANNPICFMDPDGADSAKVEGNNVWRWNTETGDTYNSISKRTGVSVENLRKWNNFKDKKIPVGTLLHISDPSAPEPATLTNIVLSDGEISMPIFEIYFDEINGGNKLSVGFIFTPEEQCKDTKYVWYQTIKTNDPISGPNYNNGDVDRQVQDGFSYKNDNTSGQRYSNSTEKSIKKSGIDYDVINTHSKWHTNGNYGHLDQPSRPCINEQNIKWSAVIALYRVNGSGEHERIALMQYGFNIENGKLVPTLLRFNPNLSGTEDLKQHNSFFETKVGINENGTAKGL
jgi:LysM repeat protein